MLATHVRPQCVPGLQNFFTKMANQARVCDVDGFNVLDNIIFQPGELSTVVATPLQPALRVVLYLRHVLGDQPVKISQPYWTAELIRDE